jgi:hypothetical protein
MTDNDKALRDQLALSELNPDSAEYRQMRLAQTLGRFKVKQGCPMETSDYGSSVMDEDAKLDEVSTWRRSPDDFDLIESLREKEAEHHASGTNSVAVEGNAVGTTC